MSLGIGFLIKKFISFLLMPLTIAAFFILLTLWALHRGKLRQAKGYVIIALIWMALISSAPVSSWLIAPLERQYARLEHIPDEVEYLVLLGGDKERRAWEAVRLYHQKPSLKIITSGYSRYGSVSEALKVKKLLQESGVNPAQILIQEKPKDTNEEALAIKQRLGTSPFLLVTSAYHMPRAFRFFKATGSHPIAAPADINNTTQDSITSFFQGKHLRKTEKALHEYIGLLWGSLKGIF
ncbi:MAG: YdcF family protein [Cocleimonas sp.]|nr:YdcF family protein [Cocleimonas sp.]